MHPLVRPGIAKAPDHAMFSLFRGFCLWGE